MGTLPYTVSYEFIPFANPDGGSAGTYNDLVYQVFLGVGKNLLTILTTNITFLNKSKIIYYKKKLCY
jgi:hypothetical protein